MSQITLLPPLFLLFSRQIPRTSINRHYPRIPNMIPNLLVTMILILRRKERCQVSFQQVFALVLATTGGEGTRDFGVGGGSGGGVVGEELVGAVWVLVELLLVIYCF